MYNTNREVLAQIQRTWGGTMSAVGQRNPGWKPSYALIWTNSAAAKLLQGIAPYLRIKARQVAALLEFQDHVRRCRRRRGPNGRLLPLPRRERLLREAFFQDLKQLNTRDPTVRGRHLGCRQGWAKRRGLSARYLAGFIDAEGSLMIVKSRDRRNRRFQYRARISVVNTDRTVLEDIQKAYGGVVVCQRRTRAGWNPIYQLVWSDGMVERLLSSVMSYIRIKQKQACLLTDFMRHKNGTRQGHNGRYFAPLPAEVMALRESFRKRVGGLNARGISPEA